MDAVRLVLDAARCDGHGICALRCPELVSLDEWGYAAIGDGTVADTSTLRRARRAMAACPERALTLVNVAPRGARPAPHLAPVSAGAGSERAPTHQNQGEGAELPSWRPATTRRLGSS